MIHSPRKKGEKNNMWKCPRCEVLNEDHLDECEVCFFSKDSIPSVVEDTWTCPRCETINNAAQDVCEVCFAAKPEPDYISESKPRRRRASQYEVVSIDKDSNSVVDYNREEETASHPEIIEEQMTTTEDVSQTYVTDSKEKGKLFEESMSNASTKANEISMGKLARLMFIIVGAIILFAVMLEPLM